MNKLEITEMVKMITGLATYFKHEIPESILEIYVTALSKRTYSEVEDAIRYFFETGIKMPLLADFNQYFIFQGGNVTALCEMKWETLIKIIGKCSSYISWTDRDTAFRRAVEGIGYDTACQATEQELKWLKKDFMKIYRSFVSLPPGSYETKPYFIGSNEFDNRYFKDLPTSRQVTYNGDRILYLNSENKFAAIPVDKITLFLTQKETLELDYDNLPF